MERHLSILYYPWFSEPSRYRHGCYTKVDSSIKACNIYSKISVPPMHSLHGEVSDLLIVQGRYKVYTMLGRQSIVRG